MRAMGTFVNEWIKRDEKVLTVDQVKRLEIGTKVTIIGADRYGECCRKECTIAQSGLKKVLVTQDTATWEKTVLPIKDHPNKRFVIQKGDRKS